MATLEVHLDHDRAEQVIVTSAGNGYEILYKGITDVDASVAEVRGLLATAAGTTLALDDPHPGDPDAKLAEIRVSQKGESKRIWEIYARYLPPGTTGSAIPPQSPLERPPEVRWSFASEIRQIASDYSKPPKWIANSAGEKFPELPEREFGELTLEYTRNEANPDLALLRQYMHTVNHAEFTVDGQSIPARYAKLEIRDAPKVTEGGVTYYRVTYFFRFREGGWIPTQVLDVGYNELDLVNNVRKPITDSNGMPVRTPYPLNGTGGKRPSPTSSPAVLEFNFYVEKDFSVFNFS